MFAETLIQMRIFFAEFNFFRSTLFIKYVRGKIVVALFTKIFPDAIVWHTAEISDWSSQSTALSGRLMKLFVICLTKKQHERRECVLVNRAEH
jgi:hypothetical protein